MGPGYPTPSPPLISGGHHWRLVHLRTYPGADQGFPIGKGANPPRVAPTHDFAKNSQKLHEIEKMLGRRGRPPIATRPYLHGNDT